MSGRLGVSERVSAPFTHCSGAEGDSVQLVVSSAGGSRLPPCGASHQHANDVITYPLSGKKM